MGYIHCCGCLQKSETFVTEPEPGYLVCRVDYLEKCLCCAGTIVQIQRTALNGQISIVKKFNINAEKFFKKNKSKLKKVQINSNAPPAVNNKNYSITEKTGENHTSYKNLSTLKTGLNKNNHLHLDCNYLTK